MAILRTRLERIQIACPPLFLFKESEVNLIKRWNINKTGWPRYFEEVATISHGRTDMQIVCTEPGIINLIKKEQQ